MELVAVFNEMKPLRAARAGELVVFKFASGRAVAIATGRGNEEVGAIYIMLPEDGTCATAKFLELDFGCMSAGTDWRLELLDGPDVFPGNSSAMPAGGYVERDREGRTALVVQQSNRSAMFSSDTVKFTLPDWTRPTHSFNGSVCFPRWRIMLRSAVNPVQWEPFLEFKAA